MKEFAAKNSIVRKIWGNSDTVLLIFAGASAEFALNKSVDWLYFTGKLPADPLDRLFSTVTYAQKIVFTSEEDAFRVIDSMNGIHGAVSEARGFQIPNHAYQDVLNLLIHYSIVAYELLERPLVYSEKEEIFKVFLKLGNRMNIQNLPSSFNEWVVIRQSSLMQHLEYSQHSRDLFQQYKVHLGATRYFLLKEVYRLITPEHVRKLLLLSRGSFLGGIIYPYKLSKKVKLDFLLKKLLLPRAFQNDIAALNHEPTTHL